MSSLNLFPARVPIGRFRGQDGKDIDIIMTPEFSRALSDLFGRVGVNGIRLDDFGFLSLLSGSPEFVAQDDTAGFEANLGAQHDAQLSTMARAMDEIRLLGAAPEAVDTSSILRALADYHVLASSVSSLTAEVHELRKAAASIEMGAGYQDQFRVNWERPGKIGSLTANSGSYTTLSATGQITSTLATGTAPLVVASTTQVSNLNVSQLIGATWVAPGSIGSSTRNAGAFTTLFANVGAAIEAGSQCVLVNADSTEYSLPTLWAGHSTQKDIVLYNGATTGASGAASVLFVSTRNSSTGRSINAAGTINASGADYAEYMTKAADCGDVTKGQIVGINAAGQITDKWADAIAFAIKSTDPSYVGGDTWGTPDVIGDRPTFAPREDGERDEDYQAREDAFFIDLISYESDLESARRAVDRIAFAGRVPCNVLGTTPGHYIIAEQGGDGIKGVSVAEPTFQQYMRAVGRVIAIEPDGRAQVVVKIG